jgi:SAM-dependent methyltransferase
VSGPLRQVPYLREPIAVVEGIPVFSSRDFYVENYVKIAADHVTSIDNGHGNPFMDEGLWRRLEASTRTLVDAHVPDGARILDVGVGLGRVLESATRLQRFGIDISLDYLSRSRDKGFEVAFARIEDMPYPDGYFDAVMACDVLEHVIDLHACCVQILRVLRPGGTLIVRVPYKDDLDAYLDESLPYDLIHIRSFDVASLRLLFGKVHGLTYVEHTFVEPYLKDALLRIRLLPETSLLRRVALDATDPDHPLWTLRKSSQVSQEALRAWLFELREKEPAVYREVLPELVDSLEVNIVFRRPV